MVAEGKGGITGDDGDLTGGGKHTIQCTDDVFVETCIILLTNVMPVNSIKRKKKC